MPFRENIGGLQSELEDQSIGSQAVDTQAPAGVVSPLSYSQIGQQLFNRELAQPEIGYLQSLYGQDVDATEMGALQKALAPNEAIGGLYQSVLGRTPDQFGQMYWSQTFGSEISPEEEAAFRGAAAPEIAARSSQGAFPSADTGPADLKNFVTQNIADPQAIAKYAQRFGSSVDDLALAMSVSPDQVRQYFRDAGFPLGTMLTGTLSRAIGTDTGIKQLEKGEDVVAERAIGMQGNKVLVQQYDAYGQPTGTRLAEPNAPDYAGWIQALGLVLPGALPGVGEAIGSALGATGAAAGALGSGVLNFGLQVAAGADPIDALKGAVLSAGAGFAGSQVSAMLPAELASVGKNAVTQLITTGKIDPAALATGVGTSFATDALVAETGVDRATAGKLITAGLQAFQGNELAALTSLTQAGLSGAKGKSTGAIDEYNVTGGSGTQISSGSGPLDYLVDAERDPNLVKTSDVFFGPYKIPGLSLGDTELASGNPFLTDDPEGGAPYLNQSIQMLDRAGNPVLDASGKPIFYTAIYDPTDESLRYSLNATDESGTFIGKNIISQKPQIIADDEGNQFVINPANGRVLATLSTALDQRGSDSSLSDFAGTTSYLDDITFSAFEDLRDRLQSNDQTVSLDDILDLEAQIFQDAIEAGATDAEAMSAAQAITNPFKSKLNEGELTPENNLDQDQSGVSGVSGVTTDDGFSGFSGQSGDSGFSGFSGVSGLSGFSGVSGDSGESGFSGMSGISGDSGFSGFSGESGASGFSGLSGESGLSGFSGVSGESGASGFSGFSGESGASGWSGISGESGASGFSGMSGESGVSGFSGFSGESGASGFSGFSGMSGDSGFSGASGVSGTSGFSGFSGIAGESGFSGYSGASGLSGFSGASGISGESGFSGFSGISGVSGYSGASGISGESGFSGFSGTSGVSGFSGFSGESGISGFSGVSGVSGTSGFSGFSGVSGISGVSGFSGFSGRDGRDGKTVTSMGSLAANIAGSELPRLAAQMLEAKMTQDKFIDPLEGLKRRVQEMIDPSLAAVMSQRLGIQQAPTFTYGQDTSIDDILGTKPSEESAFAQGGFVAPLRAINPQFMNRGGALGREDFREGKHVAGEGDGQSDDIPAWLADGEFVFPADVVSALGNGSTKAGTDKLYEMMHQIRARARSTKNKDLPPPAHKSPLDYLKKGK